MRRALGTSYWTEPFFKEESTAFALLFTIGIETMFVVGLTGSIGSGKTTCAQALAAQSRVKIIDADKLGHQSYERGSPLIPKLIEWFGESILQDGEIHRPTLGKLVFGDREKLKQLTDLVWPEILRRAKQAIEELELDEETSIVVLEAAVLLEAGWTPLVDHVILLNLNNDSEVLRRLSQRNPHLSSEDILKRLKSQMPICEKIRTLQALAKPFTIIDASKPKELVVDEVSTLLFNLTPPTAEVTASCLA